MRQIFPIDQSPPTEVVSAHDDYWNQLTEWLQKEGTIKDTEFVNSAKITLDGDSGDVIVREVRTYEEEQ